MGPFADPPGGLSGLWPQGHQLNAWITVDAAGRALLDRLIAQGPYPNHLGEVPIHDTTR